jgi:hypothetical protein
LGYVDVVRRCGSLLSKARYLWRGASFAPQVGVAASFECVDKALENQWMREEYLLRQNPFVIDKEKFWFDKS